MATAKPRKRATRRPASLAKCPTGIRGLDAITGGGLPRGRPTLVCGDAGTGKTLLGVEFLARGALDHGEPGVLVTFEENAADLATNVASIGFDLPALVRQRKLFIEQVAHPGETLVQAGEYDLEALFIRLASAMEKVGARRIVLDTIETFFSALPDTAMLRGELQRLFHWLKQHGLTAVVTAERGDGGLTRHGIEQYVSDCVITLDQSTIDDIGTRHLQILKYRGSTHGTNRYPFLIDADGISVLPITSLSLTYEASSGRISTGVEDLDHMLGGGGYYRGSSVMVSGVPGTGKTSLAAHFADAACGRGERVLYSSFEESPSQIVRNMRSIGIDLETWVEKGLLRFHCARPAEHGLETHLAILHREVATFAPQVTILDPVTGFASIGRPHEVKATLSRAIDFLKSREITALFTSLTEAGAAPEQTEVGVSSIIDTWILVRDLEYGNERNRALYVIKSRGMAHSNQVREFLLTDRGVKLVDVYVGPEGILTGSGRVTQEARDQAMAEERKRDAERRERALADRQRALEARIAALRADFDAEASEQGLAEQARQQQHRVSEEVRASVAGRRQQSRPAGETGKPAGKRKRP